MRLALDAPFVRSDNARLVAGALALGVHALFVLLLVFGVSWQTEHPAPVMVDLWQSLPKAASQPVAVPPPESAKPAPAFKPEKPAPAPKPEAEEPPPKAPDIALEKKRAETERLKKLKAIHEAEDRARKDAAQAEADALKKARDKRQAEQKAEQKRQALLRQLEADELKQSMANESAANAARAAKLAEAQAAGARQAALSQTIGKYRDLISATVRGNTRLPDNLKGNPQVRCLVKLLPTGDVVSVRVTQSSGNPAYDEAVVRAIEKSSPLPLPTEREARAAFVPELSFTHRPKE